MFNFIQNIDVYPDGLEVWQVSVILRIAPDTVRRLIRTHKLRAYKFGRAYLINKHDLRQYIQSKSTSEASSKGCDSRGV